jgi:UDP-N-acetylmuramate dehydrogenase
VTDLSGELSARFGRERVKRRAILAPFTTFRVGGAADWLLETQSSDEVIAALQLAHAASVPVTVLGGGSNVLVSDAGIRGLVLRTRGGTVQQTSPDLVLADAAVSINGLVRWTVHHGCAGLEAWAGTPGTVGGAVFGNAHFAGHLISELIHSVDVAAADGTVVRVPASDMSFGYDRSRLQRTGEVLLAARFRVSRGEPLALRETARRSLAFRKRTQPLDTRNAGCVFRNPEPDRDRLPAGMPWSAGALVDKAGLKGLTIGGARVSSVHANFIVNEGHATARDIRRLIERCRQEVHARFGVDLREEIVYLGDFKDHEPIDGEEAHTVR